MSHGNLESALQDLKPQDHLCLVYEQPEEHLSAAATFIRKGLEQGDQCLYVADDVTSAGVYEALERSGVAVGSARESGALVVTTKKEAYLRDGYFVPQRMIKFLAERTLDAQKSGFRMLRLAAEMSWALGTEPGVDRLVEYEARLNDFFTEHACLAACQYNRARFKPETVRAVVHTHPTVIVGQTVARNLFYIPPSEYLESGDSRVNAEIDRMLRQLTALEQTQNALIRSEKFALAGRMAASIAHEINNPLEALTNLLYLSKHASGSDEALGYIEQAEHELERLGIVARQTLGFYRERSGAADIGLRNVIDEAIRAAAPRMELKALDVSNDVAPNIVVRANTGELRQVILNLVVNAADANEQEGAIAISATCDGSFCELRIADTGSGIPVENLGRVFEPFFSTKRDHGTGLGLWVVQDLVARQGGSIRVESHTSGDRKGTTFFILLPASR